MPQASTSRWSLAGASAGSLLLHGILAAAVLAAALAGERLQGDDTAAITVFVEQGTAPVASATQEEAGAEPAAATMEAAASALPPPPDDPPPPSIPRIDYAPPPPEEALAPPDFKPPLPPPSAPSPAAKPAPRAPVQAKPAPQPSPGPAPPAPQAPLAAPPGPAGNPAPSAASVAPGWNALLATWLAMHKVYPEAARRRSEEGDVTVRFVVAPDGRVSDVALVKGSGFQALDAAAIAMLRGATVPAPGVEATRTVRVRYNLKD